MVIINKKSDCSGCEACLNICPQNAINMSSDDEGFWYPVIDSDTCIGCNKCNRICPIKNFEEIHSSSVQYKDAYAYRSNNCNRNISSSGGVFGDIANAFLEEGGRVVGAAFNEDYKLKHIIAKNTEELVPLLGSKYLQSKIDYVYTEIKIELENGKRVLFVGMTCQVEGLKAFLGKDYENLYCIDLICMGIPSPMVWDIYSKSFFDIQQIKKINFKDKSNGWHNFSVLFEEKNGKRIVQNGRDNQYMECMFKGYSIRPSCFHCKFKNENKISEITIADCWGCENYIDGLDDNKGLSMVIAHNDKGKELINILKDAGEIQKFDYKNVLKYNSNYQNCTSQVGNRNLFYILLGMIPRLTFNIYGRDPNKMLIKRINRKLRRYINSGGDE